jgi:hypothetical protein
MRRTLLAMTLAALSWSCSAEPEPRERPRATPGVDVGELRAIGQARSIRNPELRRRVAELRARAALLKKVDPQAEQGGVISGTLRGSVVVSSTVDEDGTETVVVAVPAEGVVAD